MLEKIHVERSNVSDGLIQMPLFITLNELKKVNGHEEVYYCEKEKGSHLRSTGAALAMVQNVKFTNFSLMGGHQTFDAPVIMHDEAFELLPKFVQKFLLYHEIGHVVNDDINISEEESKRLIVKRAFGVLPKMEVKADAYAASVVGVDSARKALQFLIDKTDIPMISKIECRRRIRKINAIAE